jgi:hypothetical protein
MARRLNLGPREAAAWAERAERLRGEFVRRAFRQDVADPHHYDLVLNTSRLSVEEAADVIIRVLQGLEGRSGSAAPAAPAGRTGALASA